MSGQATVTLEAVARLRPDEVLVFDWVHIAFCCAGAGEVSLHALPARRITGSSRYLPLRSEPSDLVYAHRAAFPHLAGRATTIGVAGRRFRRFTSDLPHDFGLRCILGREESIAQPKPRVVPE